LKKKMLIKEIGEFKLIERIKKQLAKGYNLPKSYKPIVVGIGDDAAVVETEPDKLLVATTDILIEDIHFDLKTTSPYDLGWKLLAVNLSDIAAMGATPRYGLVVLGLPVNTSVETVDNLIHGALDLAKKFKVFLIGGDTVTSPDKLVVNLVLWGTVPRDRVLKRSGAKVKDKIMVTGTIGDSSAGLEILQTLKAHTKTSWARKLINKHLLPYPRLQEAGLMARRKLVHGMIDSSDGLSISLKFICQASRVGAKIWADKIPLSRELRCYADFAGRAAYSYALYGGEDYELIFTVPADKEEKIKRLLQKFSDTRITTIGEIVPAQKGLTLVDNNGKITELKTGGYEHFSPS
jgi:thiamine-monophosphate kinase